MFSGDMYKKRYTLYVRACVSLYLVMLYPFFDTSKVSYAQELQNRQESTVQVAIILEGKTVKGIPKVVPAENTFNALYEKVKDEESLTLKQTRDDTWLCDAIEGKEYVIGWIVKKGWFEKKSKMFGYYSEPFTAKEGLTVEFSPGMPATFEYDLRNPPEGVKNVPAEVFLLKETVRNGEKSFLSWDGSKKTIKTKGILKISGLAAGKYKISAQTSDAVKDLSSRIPILHEDREVVIKEGSNNRFEPNYPVIDSTIEEGDVTIRGTVYGNDKKPLAKKVVKVIPLGENGFDLSLYYPIINTDSKGRFEFTGIRPNSMVYVSAEDKSIFLNKNSLTEGAVVSTDIVVGQKPLNVITGQPMQNIILNLKEDETIKLSDFTGMIVVVDVWATWCAPCIRALPELNSLAGNFNKNEDIIFITISVDADRAIWEKVIAESAWNSFRHCWFDEKENSLTFKKPIPYTFIIDQKGIVRAEGNSLNIKNELEKVIGDSSQNQVSDISESDAD